MEEKDIIHENGDYWVGKESKAYTVYKNVSTHSESMVSYTKDSDGLSLAISYCDYLAKFGMNKGATEDKGWIVVPKEPTIDMLEAGNSWSGLPSATWSDMIDASPEYEEDQSASFIQEAYEQGFRDGLKSKASRKWKQEHSR